jgi:hypothetical protein
MSIRVTALLGVVRSVVGACVLGAALLLPAVALAQDTGVVFGVATDVQGKPQRLPGVQISIRTANGTRSAVTDAQGRYRIAGLPLGTHRVVADLPGFTLTAREVELTSRYPESDASFVMYLGPLDETSTLPPQPNYPMLPRYRVWPLGPETR